MTPSDDKKPVTETPGKAAYATPELIELGEINDLVQFGFQSGQDGLLISDSLT